MTWKVDSLLFVIEKIDREIKDTETASPEFRFLWKHPFLRDTFKDYLKARHCVRLGRMTEDDVAERRMSLENICGLLCPDFSSIIDKIIQE